MGLNEPILYGVYHNVEALTQSIRDIHAIQKAIVHVTDKKDAVLWSCDGSPDYTIVPAKKAERGTDIILHISEDNLEFLEIARIETLLKKYCKFLPVEIKFDGKVITQVTHINGGKPCERTSEMTFRITGKRKYWRLQQIDNPCDGVADYVDIYFR